MKGENIAIRLRAFAAGVVQLSRRLPDDATSRHISRQLVRAATAGGANYEEARGAESRADFIHKLAIANKETREALYWLGLVKEAEIVVDANVSRLIREADELVAILTASIRTAKRTEASAKASAEASASASAEPPAVESLRVRSAADLAPNSE